VASDTADYSTPAALGVGMPGYVVPTTDSGDPDEYSTPANLRPAAGESVTPICTPVGIARQSDVGGGSSGPRYADLDAVDTGSGAEGVDYLMPTAVGYLEPTPAVADYLTPTDVEYSEPTAAVPAAYAHIPADYDTVPDTSPAHAAGQYAEPLTLSGPQYSTAAEFATHVASGQETVSESKLGYALFKSNNG
jgi:hypothetical protein